MDAMDHLSTEGRNPASMELDRLSPLEIVTLMNDADGGVASAVRECLPRIAQAVGLITGRLRAGGRLIYVGAGTSGRLAALDAYECVPTFGMEPGRVCALVAGSLTAVSSGEEAEDDGEAGARELAALFPTERDAVVGVAASGRTPYVAEVLRKARACGAAAIAVACNRSSLIGGLADVAIEIETGPEILTGSTRLKAGTAQKMVLNMLSTASMAGLGHVYENLMVNVEVSNEKLRGRALRIIREAAGASDGEASAVYEACGGNVRAAVVALKGGVFPERAEELLRRSGGGIRQSLETMREEGEQKNG